MTLQIGKRKNKGFLLLEVMVSVAILSVGLLLILNSFMRSIRAMDSSEDYFKAGLLLEERIYEIYNSKGERGSSGGPLPDFNNTFSWHLDVVKSEEKGLDEVMLKILWNKRNAGHELSLVTYLK